MRSILVFCAVLALAACERAEEAAAPVSAPQPAPAPAPTPGPYDGEFRALGTEPFWAVEVRADSLKLSRPDFPDMTVANPGPTVEAGSAVWRGDGLTLTLTEGQCSDGMSDRVYPWRAVATTAQVSLQGCAARPEALKAEPRP